MEDEQKLDFIIDYLKKLGASAALATFADADALLQEAANARIGVLNAQKQILDNQISSLNGLNDQLTNLIASHESQPVA